MQNNGYNYRGARALVILHEERIRSFFNIWKEAKARSINLPVTSDPDYASMEALLVHILRSAGGYTKWICKNLKLDDPLIDPVPLPESIAAEADTYINHLVERWNLPLVEFEESVFFSKEFKSNWGPLYCIEAMLEHAVLHPMRHEFQLKELIANKDKSYTDAY